MRFLDSEDTIHLKVAAKTLVEDTEEKSRSIREKANLILDIGRYDYDESGIFTEIAESIKGAYSGSLTLLPDDSLPVRDGPIPALDTQFQVRRRTAVEVAKELADLNESSLILCFADGLCPGVVSRYRSRTQEELLCRTSALEKCLEGSNMYAENRRQGAGGAYSSSCVLSPNVPVFMDEKGKLLEKVYFISFISCAAPLMDRNNLNDTEIIIKDRIARILEIAMAYGYKSLVLGAWGCGGCQNDPCKVAHIFFNS